MKKVIFSFLPHNKMIPIYYPMMDGVVKERGSNKNDAQEQHPAAQNTSLPPPAFNWHLMISIIN